MFGPELVFISVTVAEEPELQQRVFPVTTTAELLKEVEKVIRQPGALYFISEDGNAVKVTTSLPLRQVPKKLVWARMPGS